MAGKKGQIPWNKGMKTGKPAWNTGLKATPAQVEKNRQAALDKYAKGWKPRVGKKHSEETKEKIREKKLAQGIVPMTAYNEDDNLGSKNVQWKGDDVGYSGLHSWISFHYGKPLKCSYCLKSGGKTTGYHWANISGLYLRDIKDFIRLCASCHKNMDKGNIKIS